MMISSQGATRLRRSRSALLVSLSVIVVAGCQGGPEPLDDGVAAFDLLVENSLQDAREAGASDTQITVIEEAQETGAVTIEALRAGNQATAECLRGHGFEVDLQDFVTNAGLTVPSYAVHTGEVPDDLALELQEGCEYAENYWVNKLYWLQPSSIAINNAHLIKQTPVLIECIIRNGGAASEGDDTRVALDAAQALIESSGGTIDCLYEAEIDGY